MSFLPSFTPVLRAKVLSHPFVRSNPTLHTLLASPAGPFTIHFWAPTFKWCITIANLADLRRPIDQISTPQQIAVTATGLIWSRYSFVIVPVNYTLFSVNVFMAGSGLAQLSRKVQQAWSEEGKEGVVAVEKA